jgi:hypothetical protein
VKFIDGIGNALPKIQAAAVRVSIKFLNGIANSFPRLVDAGFKAVIKLLNGIEKAIRDNSKELRAAGWGIADAIIDGMLDGFKELWTKVEALAESLASKLPGPFKKALGIKSPSQVFMTIGRQTMEGLAVGLASGGEQTSKVMGDVAKSVIDAASDEFGKAPNVLEGIMDMDPTITPVLDLSNVEASAKRLGELTTPPVLATVSAGQASNISAETAQLRQDWENKRDAEPVPTQINLEQNNYSPESLSDTEIYRQTKNQLGQLKHVLGVPTKGYAAYGA